MEKMGCCGNKRKEWLAQQSSLSTPQSEEPSERGPTINSPDRLFQYIGKGSFVVKGPISGKTYRFMHTGATTGVDYSDAFALMAERHLRIAKAE